MGDISENLKNINLRIQNAAGRVRRDPASIKLVTVTKTIPVKEINCALSAGAITIGENRVQEARDKFSHLLPCVRHLIGNLQKNKVKYIFDLFDVVQTVDSANLAFEIDRRAEARGVKMDILIQVNISDEKTKSGIALHEAEKIVTEIMPMKHISIKGLMCIPHFSDNPETSRPFFKQLFDLKNRINENLPLEKRLTELSMGMSDDFEVAVEEGATIVRVGRAIFGERN